MIRALLSNSKVSRRLALLLAFSLFVTAVGPMFGCGGATESVACADCQQGATGTGITTDMTDWNKKTPVSRVYVRSNGNDAPPTFYDEGRRQLTDAQVTALVTALPKDGKSAIELAVLNQPQAGDVPAPDWGFQIGCYYVRLSWEKHYVGSCIGRDTWHLGFLIKNNCNQPERMILNAHASVWWENGPQFGLYNSANGWCAQSRGNWTAIRDKVIGALAVVGVTGWLAYLIANATAGVVVVAFGI